MEQSSVLVDAHVHVYPGVDVDGMLRAAVRNFRRAAAAQGIRRWQGVLMLTETSKDSWFESVAMSSASIGNWHFRATDEPITLRAVCEDAALLLVAGRQVVTSERLEVHALGSRARFADGQATRTTIDAVLATGALAVLPWGVGKWTGSRGRLVEDLLRDRITEGLTASDNGGRPSFWREHRFQALQEGRRPLLAGSDPLPLPRQEYRIGSFGFRLRASLPDELPGAALLHRLARAAPDEVCTYGASESLRGFLVNQLRLRFQSRAAAAHA